MSGTATLPDGRLVDSLKVVELKKELEVLGLDKNGLKKDLVRRLSAVTCCCGITFFYNCCLTINVLRFFILHRRSQIL